ncbi:hypothetical protein I316_02772 [Kwoniella heveanensis BCC8398]|uniref:GLTSCR protein conserved domain-containing protein n=1 Tax=Kwoniella heveanensis BCC8398 TaxID=1296120 RepID=A0A1B9GXF7_9TREE|nr:hypothetical protein I316_02772 [Kwoniella heveanensis BCC8398]
MSTSTPSTGSTVNGRNENENENNHCTVVPVTPTVKTEKEGSVPVQTQAGSAQEEEIAPQRKAAASPVKVERTDYGSSTGTVPPPVPNDKVLPPNTADIISTTVSTTKLDPKLEPASAEQGVLTLFPGQINAEAGPGPTSQAHQDERALAAAQRERQALDAVAEVRDQLDRETEARKRKWAMLGYEDDEVEYREGEVLTLHTALMLDQYATLYPDPPTAFTSYEDVVDRLLPYHVWQIHDEELDGARYTKADELREMREAREMVDRIRGIKEQFVKTRRKEGDHPSSLPTVISLLNDHTTTVREEFNTLSSVLRPIKAEYQALESEAKKVYEEKRRIENEKRRAEQEKIRLEQEKVRADAERITMEKERIRALEEEKRNAEGKRKRDEEEKRSRKSRPPPQPSAQGAPPSASVQPPQPHTGMSTTIRSEVQSAGGSFTSAPTVVNRAPSTPLTIPSVGGGATSTQTAASTTTVTPGPERGRPRGRPRGRGRGGARETTTPHIVGGPNGLPTTPNTASTSAGAINGSKAAGMAAAPPPAGFGGNTGSPPVPLPGTAGSSGIPAGANNAVAPVSAPAVPGPKGPIQLTVSLSLVPQLVALGILAINPAPNGPKLPAHILRTSEDKKSIILWVSLAACSKTQLLALAKLLNVNPQPPPPPTGSASASAPALNTNTGTTGSSTTTTAPAAGRPSASASGPSVNAPPTQASGRPAPTGDGAGAANVQANGSGSGK